MSKEDVLKAKKQRRFNVAIRKDLKQEAEAKKKNIQPLILPSCLLRELERLILWDRKDIFIAMNPGTLLLHLPTGGVFVGL